MEKKGTVVASSYNALLKYHQNFCDKHFHPLTTRKNCETISSYNKKLKEKIDEKFEFYKVTYQCTHFGEYETQSTTKKTKTCKINCEAFIQYVLDTNILEFKIKDHNLNHNHDLSNDLYVLYAKKTGQLEI